MIDDNSGALVSIVAPQQDGPEPFCVEHVASSQMYKCEN